MHKLFFLCALLKIALAHEIEKDFLDPSNTSSGGFKVNSAEFAKFHPHVAFRDDPTVLGYEKLIKGTELTRGNLAPPTTLTRQIIERLKAGDIRSIAHLINDGIGLVRQQTLPKLLIPATPDKNYDANMKDYIQSLSAFLSLDRDHMPSDVKSFVLKQYLAYHRVRYADFLVFINLLSNAITSDEGCKWDEFDVEACKIVKEAILSNFLEDYKFGTLCGKEDYKKAVAMLKIVNESQMKGKIPTVSLIGVTKEDRIGLMKQYVSEKKWLGLYTYLNAFPPVSTANPEKSIKLPSDLADYKDIIVASLINLAENSDNIKKVDENKSRRFGGRESDVISLGTLFTKYKNPLCEYVGDPKNGAKFFSVMELLPNRAISIELRNIVLDECLISQKHQRAMQSHIKDGPLDFLASSFPFRVEDCQTRRNLRMLKQELSELSTGEQIEKFKDKLLGNPILKKEKFDQSSYELFKLILTEVIDVAAVRAKKDVPEIPAINAEPLLKTLFQTAPAFKDRKTLKELPILRMILRDILKSYGKGRSKTGWSLKVICGEDGLCDHVLEQLIQEYVTRIKLEGNKDNRKSLKAELTELIDNLNKYMSTLKSLAINATQKKVFTPIAVSNIEVQDFAAILKARKEQIDAQSKPTNEADLGLDGLPFDKDEPLGFLDVAENKNTIRLPIREVLKITEGIHELRSVQGLFHSWYSQSLVREWAVTSAEKAKDPNVGETVEDYLLSHLLIMAIRQGSIWAILRIVDSASPTFHQTEGFKALIWSLSLGIGAVSFKSSEEHYLAPISLTSLYGFQLMPLTGNEAFNAKLLYIICQDGRCPLPSVQMVVERLSGFGHISQNQMMADYNRALGIKVPGRPKTLPEALLKFCSLHFSQSEVEVGVRATLLGRTVASMNVCMNGLSRSDIRSFIFEAMDSRVKDS